MMRSAIISDRNHIWVPFSIGFFNILSKIDIQLGSKYYAQITKSR